MVFKSSYIPKVNYRLSLICTLAIVAALVAEPG